ncbi:MAG: hypothetical protein EPO24_09155 [Bacteroidetes bacterium]|nr:MAG: hypothetical protein EPO24_09155 [Bacteroidota bacterium]
MFISIIIKRVLLCVLGFVSVNAQLKTSILIQSRCEDERIDISIDKSVYFPGDTVLLVIQRNDTATTATFTPILLIQGTTLKSIGQRTYVTVIPQTVTPGLYPVSLRVTDSEGRRFQYETDRVIAVEEYQDVEELSRYVSIIPEVGSNNIRTAVTLDREQVRNLMVRFHRDSIRVQMGPQFIRITTTVHLRDGIAAPSYERRVVTYRSHGNPYKDRAMFIQYRTAYGAYANIRPEELEQVLVPVDSLPDWAILGIHIEQDYTIKIGAVDRANAITQYFRVRGPTFEPGFALAIPKVLYDTRADDPIDYGNFSAMVRFYFIDSKSGNRFPLSAGIGIFGVDSPVDIGIGRGGFALSMFLDLGEMARIVNIQLTNKINVGLELAPFFSIEKKGRLLLVAQAGFSF